MPDLTLISTSGWEPAIRRQHALARLAAQAGSAVRFIESPRDVRALTHGDARGWAHGLVGTRVRSVQGQARVTVQARSTLVPPHLHPFAERLDGSLLRRQIRDCSPGATLVATLPWQWPAVASVRGARRVIDLSDDWGALIPGSARRVRDLLSRTADEADAVVVVSEALRELFGGRRVEVVRNGVDQTLLDAPRRPPPAALRMAYVGTLSERFDAGLVDELMGHLVDWTLDLYGSCAYARRGSAPGPELARLLERRSGSVRLHGPVPRSRLAELLDSSDVLLMPHGASCRGQDSMKIYEYSARGRAVVASAVAAQGITQAPPHLHVADGPGEMAALVQEAGGEPAHWADERAGWARAQSWAARWPAWSRALFGAAAHGGSP